MRATVEREFGTVKPRALVLDDSVRARRMSARRLTSEGFEVKECASIAEFRAAWAPGLFDVIVADWDLAATEKGDKVLAEVRERDWDVPFVLVSGKLAEDGSRSRVLEKLLELGGARFVERGTSGIEQACIEAENLIERRDLALLKVVLALRPGALNEATIQTSSGNKSIADLLADIVKSPRASHNAERPIADHLAQERRKS